MIRRLTWIGTDNTWPYRNLAMEEYMTYHVEEGECILFLWQNRHTVVIGKNQNCWKECKVGELEQDGGYLVRRLSGGGAVYHDLGNLNFTFMARRPDYDVDRQLQVIITALGLLGIHSEKTGRNDVTAGGRKFSGNAFYKSGEFCYHHGTLLLDVDKEQMSRFLNVSREKLASKSVASVKSRVVNLRELQPDLTVTLMKETLVKAFSQVYGLPVRQMNESELPQEEIDRLTGRFQSWDWKYGRKIPFDYQLERRFSWGDIQLQLHVEQGRVAEAAAYSDAMEQALIAEIPGVLKGCLCDAVSLCRALDGLSEAKGGGAADGPVAGSPVAGGTIADGPVADGPVAGGPDGAAAASGAPAETEAILLSDISSLIQGSL